MTRRLGRIRVPQQFRTSALDAWTLGQLMFSPFTSDTDPNLWQFNFTGDPFFFSFEGGALEEGAILTEDQILSIAEGPGRPGLLPFIQEGLAVDPTLIPTP